MTAGNGQEQTARAFERHVIEQRVGDGFFGCQSRAVFTDGLARAHHRRAHVFEDGAHVGKVEINQAVLHNQIDNASNARIEHLIGQHECFGKCRLGVGDAE